MNADWEIVIPRQERIDVSVREADVEEDQCIVIHQKSEETGESHSIFVAVTNVEHLVTALQHCKKMCLGDPT